MGLQVANENEFHGFGNLVIGFGKFWKFFQMSLYEPCETEFVLNTREEGEIPN